MGHELTEYDLFHKIPSYVLYFERTYTPGGGTIWSEDYIPEICYFEDLEDVLDKYEELLAVTVAKYRNICLQEVQAAAINLDEKLELRKTERNAALRELELKELERLKRKYER